jgi:hypothetical protein
MDLVQAVRDAKPGETVKVPAGRYTVNLELTRPVTLIAMGQVVLDGVHAGSVVRVSSPGVRLSGFTIVGGSAPEAGGGIALIEGELELIDCTVRFNKAPSYGGGGLFVHDGKALVTRCRFEANTGRQGGAILVDSIGVLQLEDSTVIQNAAVEGGGIAVRDGAKVEISGCTIADNKVVGEKATGGALRLAGTSTRAPVVTVRTSIISERSEGLPCVANFEKHPASLSISASLLPPWCKALGGEGNRFLDPAFVMSGTEPYLLSETSPAVGAASASSYPAGAKDVAGRARVRGVAADLGAFAFIKGGSSNLPY